MVTKINSNRLNDNKKVWFKKSAAGFLKECGRWPIDFF